MYDIRLSNARFSHRPEDVRRILKPLRGGEEVACEFCPGSYAGGRALAAHDGVDREHLRNPRDVQFATLAVDIFGQYFELWTAVDNGRSMALSQASFALYVVDRTTRSNRELISVHCEPRDNSVVPLCTYKRGPHLHVVQAEQPLPHCHWPLNFGHLDDVCSSVEKLTQALSQTMNIICHEVLRRYPVRA